MYTLCRWVMRGPVTQTSVHVVILSSLVALKPPGRFALKTPAEFKICWSVPPPLLSFDVNRFVGVAVI